MQLRKTTDTHSDSPLEGRFSPLANRWRRVRDAVRRASAGVSHAAHRWVGRGPLIRYRDRRFSVGLDVGAIGLDRLEPQDVGA